MLFSKSFGYAIRAILYMAERQQPGKYIKADRIAADLDIPRHFLSKVMKSMSKKKILNSSKGPTGGFALNEETPGMPLAQIAFVTKDIPEINNCMLTFRPCNLNQPCALHEQLEKINNEMLAFLNGITVADLLNKEKKEKDRILSSVNPNPLTETSAA